ncbi:MAG: 3-oxoacyl-ACP reductase FabG [Alcaligenaceae bacterium]|nr:3-oxoacyl-ACP reductase FabG [Alcaligenaceae bacterium]
MDKKIVIVTGASRGIGQEIAKQLIEMGFYVVGTTRSQTSADQMTEAFSGCGEGRIFDVNMHDEIPDFVTSVAKLGQLYGLINNAGISSHEIGLKMTDDAWHKVLDTNLHAPFFLARASLKYMLMHGEGRIVNISSVLGSLGMTGLVNYCSAKSGLNGMTRVLATEMATKGITVNAVAPGFIKTAMTADISEEKTKAIVDAIPMGCMGEPKDVANMVSFLMSDKSSYITGQVFHVNGGMLMV